ncbi:hypothetical protein ETD86_35730 [Nonomuraea turkmeniaca]|uniref:Uncharacterized protein n=1 Tax=Nonomuraea turkmeniaca TaxID=103838 RepID=A0A5S4F5G1_9ACTN|nr:hypothetical protein [Nonomuraea turkmeniaca]TMR11479.1 hypothetical protein ETD86_35730 [Nonomuraea turkmeniaca]
MRPDDGAARISPGWIRAATGLSGCRCSPHSWDDSGSALVRALTAAPDLDGWGIVERLLTDLAPLADRIWLVIDDVRLRNIFDKPGITSRGSVRSCPGQRR